MNSSSQKSKPRLVLLALICILFMGCTFEQPKAQPQDIFESFITAIYKKDKEAILGFIHPDSRNIFSSEFREQIIWYESLRDNTKRSKPKFLKLNWIKRGSLVKVIYTHSENLEDYLPMIFQNDKWWIDFRSNNKLPANLDKMDRFVPSQ